MLPGRPLWGCGPPLQILRGAAGSIREVRRQVSRSTVRIQDLVPREVGLQGKCQREGNSWGLWQQGLWSGHQRVPQTQEVSDLVTGTLLSPQSLLFEVQVIFHGASLPLPSSPSAKSAEWPRRRGDGDFLPSVKHKSPWCVNTFPKL